MKTNRKFAKYVSRGQYRLYVGPGHIYDMKGAWQFMIMCLLGLRDYHKLLEIGCGSLRAGRLFIPYLRPGNYFGLEPQEEMVKRGLESELGQAIIDVKRPKFAHNDGFDLSRFGKQRFDYVLSHNVIMHLSTPAMKQSIKSAAKMLMPTGILVANYVAGSVTDKKRATYPEMIWHSPASVKLAVKSAELVYNPLRLVERHPAARWFMATRPGYEPTGGFMVQMLNRYWHGK